MRRAIMFRFLEVRATKHPGPQSLGEVWRLHVKLQTDGEKYQAEVPLDGSVGDFESMYDHTFRYLKHLLKDAMLKGVDKDIFERIYE
jgi:hypothetical protein